MSSILLSGQCPRMCVQSMDQIPLANPSSSLEWPNPWFKRFFRTRRTEGPQKNNLQADGLQWSSPRGRGSSLSMRQWTMIKSACQKLPKKLGVHQICVRRVLKWEGLKYYKRKFTKFKAADSWEGRRPNSRSLVGSSWSGCLQSHQPLSRL